MQPKSYNAPAPDFLANPAALFAVLSRLTAAELTSGDVRISHGPVIGADGVAFDGLELLHRHAAGDEASYITFHQISGGRLINLCAMLRGELRTMPLLPVVMDHLSHNGYASINPMFRTGREFETVRGQRIRRRALPDMRPPYRSSAGARYLNACFCDIDAHGTLTDAAIFAACIELQRDRVIPFPSLFKLSGRGCWLFWLLRGETGELCDGLPVAPRAWPESCDLHRRIETAIVNRPELRKLGADPGATDIARIARVAGSINTKADAPVLDLRQLVNGHMPFYTLRELADCFDAQPPPVIRRALRWAPRSVDRDRDPVKQAAARQLWQHRLADLEALRSMRGGGFDAGCRSRACYLYAVVLARCGRSESEIHRFILDVADASNLEHRDAEKSIASAARCTRWNLTHRKFADWLSITAPEADRLRVLPAQGAAPRVRRPRTTAARRAALRRLLDRDASMPVRKLAADLGCSIGTVTADLDALGIDRRRGRRRDASGAIGFDPPTVPASPATVTG